MANTNTSATGGPLLPAPSPAPLEGLTLNEFLQVLVAGITDLDGTLVRPRYQTEPPNIPPAFTAWAAVGSQLRHAPTFAFVQHRGAGDGSDELQRHEELDVLCSFYDTGTNGQADWYAALLRDGLAIAQNRESLYAAEMGLIGVGDLIAVPPLFKQRWLYRVDLTFSLRRCIRRVYPVFNLLSAEAVIKANEADSSVITQPVVVEP